MPHLDEAATIDEAIAVGVRLVDLGWHLQIHVAAELIAELAPAIRRAPVPAVIDHMGRIDASRGLEQPEFRALLDLLQDRIAEIAPSEMLRQALLVHNPQRLYRFDTENAP
jgi:2-pyrone-4,6-dicarboxylate lactonase